MRVTNLTEKGCYVTQARLVASKYARERVPPALVSDVRTTVMLVGDGGARIANSWT